MKGCKLKFLKQEGDSVVLLGIAVPWSRKRENLPLLISSSSGASSARFFPVEKGLKGLVYRIELFARGNAAAIYRGGYGFYLGPEKTPLLAGAFLGKKITAAGYRYKFSRTEEGLLHLQVNAVWGGGEKTKEERDANATEAYAHFRELPLVEDEVFFESMSTRLFNDNPKAIYEELASRGGYQLVWGLSDEKTDVGPGGIAVRYRSLEYWRHFATAKYIVSNMNQLQLVKRPGQVVVQTMHGIPLKHMGLIVTKKPWKIERMKKLFGEDWDYFVTPCDYMSDILRGPSYGFKGTFIEAGYPRNDALIARADDEGLKARVRKSLGVPEGKKMILWAPTWRTKKNFEVALDLQKMRAAFGNDYVLVLRAHYLEEQFVPPELYNDFVLNGNAYENANDMLIAADVLITDYSSIMFDFSLLNRPMVLFMWDYDSYIKGKRGTYFDPMEDHPEICALTTDEVVERLQHPEALMGGVEAFHARFNQFETGHASKDVVDAIWGTASGNAAV